MTPRVRRGALAAHVTVSVGWLGAVVAFLALNVTGLSSEEVELVRAAYLAMDLVGRFVIVPASLASIATGLVLALGTEWGLFRHHWVQTKFVLTTLATVALMLHQFVAVSGAAKLVAGTAAGTLPGPELRRLGTQLAADASLAIVVLLATTALSIWKPWGRTAYGRRKQQEARGEVAAVEEPAGSGQKIVLAVVVLIVVAFVVSHLAGGGLGHHGH